MSALVGRTASELARLVRAGEVSPAEVVDAHLAHIAELDTRVGAFQLVRADAARREAEALSARSDLAQLALAGVPVAIKDNVRVAGEPTRNGSVATSTMPAEADDEVVARLRAAGAVVVGKTRVPELCLWTWTDGSFGAAHNPWNLERTPGGSSGGSAAAVVAAMVPIAHGSDGGGSIRIPAAACGLVGIKPGPGVVPGTRGRSGWCGLSSNGPLATTVDDLALALAVMAGRPELAAVAAPPARLRIGVSTRPSMPTVSVDPAVAEAAHATAALLAGAGHDVEPADPPYDLRMMYAFGVRVATGVAEDADGLSTSRLERRSRPMVRAGRVVRRLGLVRDGGRDRWRRRVGELFSHVDVLVTPTLATTPVEAEGWAGRSFRANVNAGRFAPFTGPWNLAGCPAIAVPTGFHPDGMPLSVQLVAPEGGEALLLSVAKQLEQLRPWPRHAPLAG